MKAVVFEEFGAADKLVLRTVPDPLPAFDEVLIKVAACGVNNVDLQIRSGSRARVPLPHICGGEIAGTVAAAGAESASVPVGQAVAVHPYLACGRCAHCRRGRPTICDSRDTIGLIHPGGYAELVAVPARNVVPLPGGLGPIDAASLTLSGLTAWHMLVGRANLAPGEWALILGAGSGVGSIGIQVARLCGARVVTTASSRSKREKALALGAEAVVDARVPGWSTQVKEITFGRGADVILEHVGAATFAESVKALAPGGRLVTCGATTGATAGLDIVRLFSDELTLLGSRGGTADELEQLLRATAAGRIQPVIAATFPLREAANAHRAMEQGDCFGKLVLTMGEVVQA